MFNVDDPVLTILYEISLVKFFLVSTMPSMIVAEALLRSLKISETRSAAQ